MLAWQQSAVFFTACVFISVTVIMTSQSCSEVHMCEICVDVFQVFRSFTIASGERGNRWEGRGRGGGEKDMGKEGGIEQGGRREGMEGEVERACETEKVGGRGEGGARESERYVLVTVCLNVYMSTCVHVCLHVDFYFIFLIPVQYSNFVHYFVWTCFKLLNTTTQLSI